MNPRKAGFKRYEGPDGSIFATTILSATPNYVEPHGWCLLLMLDNGTQINCAPKWHLKHNPQAGGAFVIKDADKAEPKFMPEADFKRDYKDKDKEKEKNG